MTIADLTADNKFWLKLAGNSCHYNGDSKWSTYYHESDGCWNGFKAMPYGLVKTWMEQESRSGRWSLTELGLELYKQL